MPGAHRELMVVSTTTEVLLLRCSDITFIVKYGDIIDSVKYAENTRK